MDYTLPAEAYKPRLTASDPATWKPVAGHVCVPEEGVELLDNSLFKLALERNIQYLLNSFSVNHMLVPFRMRAGEQNPPDDCPQVAGWETDLRGSCAGRFMMGAGNTLRWIENKELRNRLNELIDGIEACREPDGYILAYPHIIDSLRHEEANYARAWFTHGLIDAALAGNPKAYGLLRSHADWFNQWDELHPKLLYWSHNSHQGHIASTRTYFSPVGKPEDLHIAEKYYVCDWWMDELAARHDSAIWQYPLQNPHSYLITSFEAYLDHYFATGDKAYLNATLGAWELIHDKWEHVGGSIAICENQWFVEDGKRILKDWGDAHERSHPPYSYYLGSYGHTGETCGSAFWIKLNQQLHRLFPKEEKYVAEIEKSIYNVILPCQNDKGLINYHANMEGVKDYPEEAINSCCEGQGTRILGSLPEYIYSIATDGIYVNLYEASIIRWKIDGKTVALKQQTHFPFSPEVNLKLSTPAPVKMNVYIRVPSWSIKQVDISVNGKKVATGKPGAYVTLARKWNDGDEITFSLPMELKTTKYTGIDTFPSLKWADDYQFASVYQKEPETTKQAAQDSIPKINRYAVEFGPLLLAAVYKDKDVSQHINIDKLIPDTSCPLHFNIENDSIHYFMPYWQLSKETFLVYSLCKE
ncbi:MAG: glycoside hydrolase family 127 protein [Dysgonamonadaceae bacterium]|nr:glycoside hydrolase family 127 protein [Dysgonamonadaceae bacterium]